jgi:hypothetical protein
MNGQFSGTLGIDFGRERVRSEALSRSAAAHGRTA